MDRLSAEVPPAELIPHITVQLPPASPGQRKETGAKRSKPLKNTFDRRVGAGDDTNVLTTTGKLRIRGTLIEPRVAWWEGAAFSSRLPFVAFRPHRGYYPGSSV
jgi:hypothetical protein